MGPYVATTAGGIIQGLFHMVILYGSCNCPVSVVKQFQSTEILLTNDQHKIAVDDRAYDDTQKKDAKNIAVNLSQSYS